MKERGLIKLNGRTKGKAKYYEITDKGITLHIKLKDALEMEIEESIKFYKGIKSLIYDNDK